MMVLERVNNGRLSKLENDCNLLFLKKEIKTEDWTLKYKTKSKCKKGIMVYVRLNVYCSTEIINMLILYY